MSKLSGLAISNDNFAFDPVSGQSYSLNGTGKEIIDLMIENKSDEEIVQTIVNKYDITEDEAFLEISDFLSKLRVFNLVEVK